MYLYSNNGASMRHVSDGAAQVKPAATNLGNGTPLPIAVGAAAIIGTYVLTMTSAAEFTLSDPNGAAVGAGAVGQQFVGGDLTFTLKEGPVPFQAGSAAVADQPATETTPAVPGHAAVAADSFSIKVIELPYIAQAGETLSAAPMNPAQLSAAFPGYLSEVQAAQIDILRAACAAHIVGGVVSNALGAAHTYPTQDTDQANMIASVTNSLLPNLSAGWTTPFWCADAQGAWAMRDHTAAQIQQAGSDIKTFIVAAQQRLVQLTGQVMAAATIAAVEAIVW